MLDDRSEAAWMPTVFGVANALLGMVFLRELLWAPRAQGEFLLFGTILIGDAAWYAAAVQVLFVFVIAYGCFTRHAAVVWAIVVYCGYWIASIWSFSWQYL